MERVLSDDEALHGVHVVIGVNERNAEASGDRRPPGARLAWMFDAAGHYGRPDDFELTVHRDAHPMLRTREREAAAAGDGEAPGPAKVTRGHPRPASAPRRRARR